MSHTNSNSAGHPLPAHLIEWLRHEVEAAPDHVVAVRVGLSRLALVRGLAGLPVSAGTTAIIRIAYDQHKSAA